MSWPHQSIRWLNPGVALSHTGVDVALEYLTEMKTKPCVLLVDMEQRETAIHLANCFALRMNVSVAAVPGLGESWALAGEGGLVWSRP